MNERYRYGQLRFWEMFPGILVWGTFVCALFFSFYKPLWVIVFIIIFDLLWLFRVIYFNLFVVIAWVTYRKTLRVNWQKKMESIPETEKIYHIVFLPTYKESFEIIQTTLGSLQENTFPCDRMIVVLGGEEKDREHFEQISKRVLQEFNSVFCKIIITIHPKGLLDEISGKGSNLNWMGHKVEEILQKDFSHIPDECFVVSAFDVDTIEIPSPDKIERKSSDLV